MLFPASAFLKLAVTWLLLPNVYLDTQAHEKEAAMLAEQDALDEAVDGVDPDT